VFTVYLIVTILTATANIFSAACDFIRYDKVSIAMAKAGVPESWMTTLGVLKTAGALGLLVGIDVPVIGIAAAVGLIVFFVGAIIIHLRGRDYSLGPAMLFLLLAVAALAARLASP
jgi:acid phosphatase family membrane protein YuiD